jgi:hypothetical protein
VLVVERPCSSFGTKTVSILLNPIATVEIILSSLIYESRWVSKLVFTPNPTKEYFAVVAICDIDRIAYVTVGARQWAIMDLVRITSGDQLTDVVYTDKGEVYCLTRCGDVHVLRLPEHQHQKPANVYRSGFTTFSLVLLREQPTVVLSWRGLRSLRC